MNYEFHPEALFELEKAADFYAERQRGLEVSPRNEDPFLLSPKWRSLRSSPSRYRFVALPRLRA
jgi:hypothetical protein